jgi:hypothetical protein
LGILYFKKVFLGSLNLPCVSQDIEKLGKSGEWDLLHLADLV